MNSSHRAADRAADRLLARGVQGLRKSAALDERDEAARRDRAVAAILAAAPEVERHNPRRAAALLPRFAAGGIAVAGILLILVLLGAPALIPARRSLAAEVGAALQQVNTWHLSGWKRIGGKQVRWEVWGRRRPFFYREQIGEQVIWDDGRERVQVFPADPATERAATLVLRTASRPGENENTGLAWMDAYRNWQKDARPWKETPSEVVFLAHDFGMEGPDTVTDHLHTIDKQTALPVQIEVRRGRANDSARLTAEWLQARYDQPLPAAVAGPPQQNLPGAAIVDASAFPAGITPQETTARANGVTVAVTPLAVDESGSVLVRVRGWLGDTPLRSFVFTETAPAAPPPLLWVVEAVRSRGVPAVDAPACHDENDRAYVAVSTDLTRAAPETAPGTLMLLAPLEPLPNGAPAPRRLTLTLFAAPTVMVRRSGSRFPMSQSVMRETMSVTVALPEASPEQLDIEKYLRPDWRHYFRYVGAPSLAADTALSRANFYLDYHGFEGRDASQKKTSRSYAKAVASARWQERALALAAPNNGNSAQFIRLRLANIYASFLRDNAQATRVYREVITAAQRNPKLDRYYRTRAEAELRRLAGADGNTQVRGK